MSKRTHTLSAFPDKSTAGMLLLDHFATEAMTAIMQRHATHNVNGHMDDIADEAYRMAEAMTDARHKLLFEK